MSFDSKKTILLEKKYLYVRASLGFQLEGTSTEIIPTNNGFYRFYVDNLSKALGNSYVNILYDSQDLTLQCFCSDLYMDELMSSDSSAIEDVVEELKKNTTTIVEFENGVSSAFESNHLDNVSLNAKIEEFEAGVSSAFASNHEDNVANSILISSFQDFIKSSYGNNLGFSSGPCVLKGQEDIKRYDVYLTPENTINGYGPSVWHFHEEMYNFTRYGNCIIDIHVGDFTKFMQENFFTCCKVKFLNANGELLYDEKRSYSFNGNYQLHFEFPTVSTLLSFDLVAVGSLTFFNKCIFYLGGDNYNLSSFSNNTLFLYGVDSFSSSCNQNFNYDFKGGYLNFVFRSNLPIKWLKNWNYVFITDGGNCSFKGSDLGLTYDNVDTSLVVCGTLPNIVPPMDCYKLLGIRVNSTAFF